MHVQIVLGSVMVAEWPLSCSLDSPYVLFVICLFVILVISHFGYVDKILVLT